MVCTRKLTHLYPSRFQDVSIWRDLYQRLNQLIAAQDRTSQSALQVSRPPIPHEITHDFLDTLSGHVADELGLGILIALREAPPDPPLQGRSTKKRRLEPASSVGSDRGASPLASTSTSNSQTQVASEQLNANSPASRIPSPILLSSLPPMFTQTQTRSQVGLALEYTRSLTGAPPRRAIPRALSVLDRPASEKPSDTAGDDYWIMAKVVKCISGDRNRYEVEDVDEEDG
ncbi:hypothetical protein Pst134EA_031466 [Puccinia striiformis f. sp. tritici]|uniref:uncharacterized protein n=1 Tax=Puccinia striiformis f. sp. tritici TaxID=168172 RepID=UPI0020076ED4|nr:uncharacterized protein Pst134EA_031466 [Puccinia striiformis f. sp. tritici]KAH9445290.1 hypothetical protein Pst134EA_031466 [Puccinia striiformis f. sp. tritici]